MPRTLKTRRKRPKRGPLLFDAVVVSNFAIAGRLDLLADRYGGRAFLTSEVLDEITAGITHGHDSLRRVLRLVDNGVFGEISVGKGERSVYLGLRTKLGAGEASCIAGALSRHGVVASDDRTARNACADAGVAVTGTVGILKAMCADKMITVEEADDILRKMIDAGFYSPVRRIGDVV